jgi:hypothetical protein
MKIKTDSFNIVIVGHWNRHIFNPKWVGKNIFNADKIQIEFPLNAIVAPRYTYNSVRCDLWADRLVFTALSNTDEVLTRLQEITKLTFSLLPHTPIVAFGFNFGFEETPISPEAARLFGFVDNANIAAIGADISSYNISRNIQFNGNEMSLTLMNDNKKIDLDINYNFNVTDIPSALKRIDTVNIVSLKNQSLEFIKKVYNLSID